MKGVVGAEACVIMSGMRCAQRAWDIDWELMAGQDVGVGGMAGRGEVGFGWGVLHLSGASSEVSFLYSRWPRYTVGSFPASSLAML